MSVCQLVSESVESTTEPIQSMLRFGSGRIGGISRSLVSIRIYKNIVEKRMIMMMMVKESAMMALQTCQIMYTM